MKHKRTAAALCLGTLLAGALTGITLFLGRRQTVEMAQRRAVY